MRFVLCSILLAACGSSGDACKELEAKICKDLPADQCAASMKALIGDTPAGQRDAECAGLARSDENIETWRRMEKLRWERDQRNAKEKKDNEKKEKEKEK